MTGGTPEGWPAGEPPGQGAREPNAPEPGPVPPPEGPPGGGVFSLEGRRAPGLYLIAWVLSVGGLAVAFVLGPMASDPAAGTWLIGAGVLALTVGLAAAAGSQVLERSTRPPERYRGPAPLLVFAAYFFALSLVGLVLLSGLGVDADQPFAFLGIGVVQAAGYVLAVWLFAIRTGALTWRQMGWPTWSDRGAADLLRAVGMAVVVMLPVAFGLAIVGGIVAQALGIEGPSVLPQSSSSLDDLWILIAAALVIPVGEEIFFRGFTLTAWLRDLGPRSALIRASLFFALVHTVNISGVDFATGLGQAFLQLIVLVPVAFVLGWLFLRYGLAGAIAGHITYNGFLLALAALAGQLPEPGSIILLMR